jgi:sugar phosphate isomerase/epimerase
MDEIVKQALVKWPNVPHCTGWLLLDRRGQWRMRDEAAQAAGELGTVIRHDALLGFINRNYECDDEGQWFFQNGPQRVYVELAVTPWIVRLSSVDGALTLTDQTGAAFDPAHVWIDDTGGILFTDHATPARVAALHDHDIDLFANHASLDDSARSGVFHWRAGADLPLQQVDRASLESAFGFVASPASR